MPSVLAEESVKLKLTTKVMPQVQTVMKYLISQEEAERRHWSTHYRLRDS